MEGFVNQKRRPGATGGLRRVATISKIEVEISVVLGRTKMPIHQLLRMGRGAVIELEASGDDLVEVVANDVPIARGQVVLKDDRITVSITEVLPRSASFRARETARLVA
jgi:flagellar motor switch protein FliN/FliY